MEKVQIGIMSTAKIAREYVIPAMQISGSCTVTAIASRDLNRAEKTANDLGIDKAYYSYEQLLNDDTIEAVYIPLPNHLHVEWSIKALEAGKHVLCEKPIGMNSDEARTLKKASEKFPHLKLMEGFMYRHHPRWQRVIEILRSGNLGEIKSVHSFFSYFNRDSENYRNHSDMGGGALMDIGCYSVSVARLVFGCEPDFVVGYSDYDPDFEIDRLTSGLLSFGTGTSVFTCSTQCQNHQYVKIFGDDGMLELNQPFNTDFTEKTTLEITRGDETASETFAPSNHFTLQADVFANCIRKDTQPPVSIDDSIANMEVLDRIRSS